jgi:hypothetical protein
MVASLFDLDYQLHYSQWLARTLEYIGAMKRVRPKDV